MFRDTRTITALVVHCSASPNGKHVTVKEIDEWHRERGFKRGPIAIERDPRRLTSIGYHRVIYPDGQRIQGRDFDEVGAHAPRPRGLDGLTLESANYGGNAVSVGVCLIGTDAFTLAQWEALRAEVSDLIERFDVRLIYGHRDLTSAKTCPNFSVREWLEGGMVPVTGMVF